MKQNRTSYILTVLFGFAALLSPIGATTLTFTVADGYDDAYSWASTSQNYSDDSTIPGYYGNGYLAPYIIGCYRFSSVTIPAGTTILHAYLRVQAYWDGSGATLYSIAGEAYDSTSAYNMLPYIASRSITAASVSWNVSSAWVEDGVYTSPDIKNVVQEIVNRSGWASGNAMAIQLRNAANSGGFQDIYSVESAATYGASPVQLIIEYDGGPPPEDEIVSEAYIPGARDAVSLVPTYLNDPDMYYPAASGGLCWATAAGDILAYWDRNPYAGVQYWNLIDNGTAPLLQPSQPTAPGHDQADVKSVVAWLADQYYGEGRTDEDVMIEEIANTANGLAFNATYHGPVSSTAERTTMLGIVKSEINAGRPASLGSWGTYFGGAHQVPVIGYKEMLNTANSTVYIHRNMGGTGSEYVNFYASSWGNLDMDQIVPGGTPVDQYEAQGDNTSSTAVSIDPDDVYDFRQTHNFSFSGDQDWVSLSCVSGRRYTIQTTALGTGCDSVLTLFQSDGTTQIVVDANGGSEARSSKIEWNCWSTGTYLIRVSDELNGYGHAANYDLQVSYGVAVNNQPTDLSLSALTIAENQPVGSTVGQLSTTDPDQGDSHTYALVAGSGSADNSLFTINGAALQSAASFNYESKSSYSVRVRTTDQGGLWREEVYAITVTDVVESPPAFQAMNIINGAGAEADSIVIQWSSIPNHSYGIWYSTNLLEGFSILVDGIPATPPVNAYTTTMQNASSEFWKVSTEE